MSKLCPECRHPLTADGDRFYCEQCQRRYAMQAVCPDCRQPVQVLKACGAVDYFCTNGHGLLSKKRVEFAPLIETL